MIKLLEILEESKSLFLNKKIAREDALQIVNKILKELPKEYYQGLKIVIGSHKIIDDENNASYDRYTDTLNLGKDLFKEQSDDFNYWYTYFNKLSDRDRLKTNIILTSGNDYGLTGLMFGYENLRNVIYHEIGHRVFWNEEFKKKYNRLKPKNTYTTSRYKNYFEDKSEEYENNGKMSPKGLFNNRMQSEQFAENFRLYWLRKNGKSGK